VNAAIHKWGRQGGAILLLLLAFAAAWALVIHPIVAIPQFAASENRTLADEIETLRERFTRTPSLQRRRADATAGMTALQVLWRGNNGTQIGAAIQDVIRSATQQSGGQVVSISTDTSAPNVEAITLSVRARITGTLATLQHVLGNLELARPRIFVDSLEVTANQGASSAQYAQQLSFEISVFGYVGGGLSGAP
jgi:hypothetical protein